MDLSGYKYGRGTYKCRMCTVIFVKKLFFLSNFPKNQQNFDIFSHICLASVFVNNFVLDITQSNHILVCSRYILSTCVEKDTF